jgi:hypothetical protein
MTVLEKLSSKGFIYNKGVGSMAKRGSHVLDTLVADAYVKFNDTQTEIYRQEEDSWKYFLLDANYNLISEKTITEDEILAE